MVSRKNRIWSVNSDVFHARDCPAAKRISADNRKSGTAPADLKPHDCIVDAANESPSSGSAPAPAASTVTPALKDSDSLKTSEPAYAVVGHDRHVQHESLSGSAKKGAASPKADNEINPYCRCNPCKCQAPCTCGLRKTETTTQIQWDAAQQLLRHIVTEIFRPDPAAIMQPDAVTAQQSPVLSPAPVATPVSEALLKAGLAESIKHAVISHYQSEPQDAGHAGHQPASVRKSQHKGHQIELRTRYEVLINDQLLDIHIGLSNDGKVHCHSIPNYATASGIDLIKTIIDAFPDDYPPQN